MENRNFQLDTEWNVVHYPQQPTGFGILIIGDERSFVDKENSFWTQNEGRLALINHFKQAGYTVFYSNLYGKNWGSDKAVRLAKQLYDFMMRTEILNGKIHILAEGMGALVALKLVKEMGQGIRSVELLNPVLTLKDQLEHEKENKFFYKKILKEIALSYGLDVKEVEKRFLNMDIQPNAPLNCPLNIIHILSGNRSYKQSELSSQLSTRWEEEGKSVSICYMLPEKKSELNKYLINLFKANEIIL
jgi:hypothetical protein